MDGAKGSQSPYDFVLVLIDYEAPENSRPFRLPG